MFPTKGRVRNGPAFFEDSDYHCSFGPTNQKSWIEVKSSRFSYLQPIQYLVVLGSGAKPAITPTNRR
jgi:hypothetical protein